MRFVRDRDDARWLPTRFHFALFRLIAIVRMSLMEPRTRPGIIVAVDRYQSTVESYTISVWYFVTVSCFFSAVMPLWAAIAVASLVVQLPIYVVGRGQGVNSIILMSSATLAAAYLITQQTWLRFVAAQFLAILALNAIAALILLPMRGTIRKLEARCGL